MIQEITNWHIAIAGFTQKEGHPNGWNLLWYKLNALSSPSCVVEYREWKFSYSDLAEQIWLFRPQNHPPIIKIYGYSYGGYSAVKLARELHRRDLIVKDMVLADAVYRHWDLLGQWRSMVPWSKIIIPPNVIDVTWFRQVHPRFAIYRDDQWCGWERVAQPAGHEVIASSTVTRIRKPIILDCEHTYVDDHPLVHQKVLEVAGANP